MFRVRDRVRVRVRVFEIRVRVSCQEKNERRKIKQNTNSATDTSFCCGFVVRIGIRILNLGLTFLVSFVWWGSGLVPVTGCW